MPFARFWSLSFIVLVFDQASKTWAGRFREASAEVFEWEGFLRFGFTYVTNPGASFSMLSNYPEFLTCLAIAALLCIWSFRKALELERHQLQFIFGSIFGGIAGNLTDRLFRGGEVVDFIDLTFQFIPSSNDILFAIRHFPVFNIADSAIFLGVVFYLIIGFTDARQAQSESVATND